MALPEKEVQSLIKEEMHLCDKLSYPTRAAKPEQREGARIEMEGSLRKAISRE